MAINETGRWEADRGLGCTETWRCGWTNVRICYSGCLSFGYSDGCTGYAYSNVADHEGTESGNEAAFSFNIIGSVLLASALCAIFVKSCQEKSGRWLRQMVGLSALCALIATIAIMAGNSGRDECWDDPFPEEYATSASPGISFYFEIVIFVVLVIAGYLIHVAYGRNGPSDYTRL